jgi:hypothetical protein
MKSQSQGRRQSAVVTSEAQSANGCGKKRLETADERTRFWRRVKAELPARMLVLFRMGDFYELFFEDAQAGAKLLDVELTQRGVIPMCGFPFHAASGYIERLRRAGRGLAICECDPETGKREVAKVLCALPEEPPSEPARPGQSESADQKHESPATAEVPTAVVGRTPKRRRRPVLPLMAHEYKIVSLRECPPVSPDRALCDQPERAAEYWMEHVVKHPYYNPDAESFVVLMLDTRRRVKGHQLVSIGTLDTLLITPRETFRAACIDGAAAIVVMHNHPSGDPSPSEADIAVTRQLIRSGQLLQIVLLDHVIMGTATATRFKHWCSLKELGYF